MPYSSPNIIYSTINYKNNIHEIFKPKYVINESIIKKIKLSKGFNMKFSKSYVPLYELENIVNDLFFKKINR